VKLLGIMHVDSTYPNPLIATTHEVGVMMRDSTDPAFACNPLQRLGYISIASTTTCKVHMNISSSISLWTKPLKHNTRKRALWATSLNLQLKPYSKTKLRDKLLHEKC
jgi:hypothetical protein